MTVRQLIKLLLDCDQNAEIDVYVGAQKRDLDLEDINDLADDEYVIDEWYPIDSIEESETITCNTCYHIQLHI